MKVNFIEEQVTIKGDVVLKGTLTVPNSEAEKFPAVLIVNGSGGADRDGNMKKPPMEANIYKELAHFVTSLGFITLRYDKRGVGESEGDQLTVGVSDLINDILSNIKFLQNHPRVDRDKIILIGHSEGCILATIANTIIPAAGLVLLAGAGTNLWAPMKYQNAQILEEVKHKKGLKGFILRLAVRENVIRKQQEALFNKMINSTEDIIRLKGKKVPAKWFREHFKYSSEDILKALSDAKCPILAVTGDKDVQANAEDLKAVENLKKDNIKAVVIENMDHMLKEFSGEKTVLDIMKQYKSELHKPMHPQLKIVLGQWLTG
ncbi:alpha/beta fold hydrolase [Clostridium sp. A1-XYC3]|uniref:Alpha/beta fold hydrolase n=1 Tax=Clostridium tanneri TaxID=3037988 RepID=A0ABU4JTM9_9CLOT|nr:alpha/beta fold hydrolase [Clostridium sp. A1-XYC3]MDW8801512.1 alpha/beta fold hydrolase [Clostridium sp. A1-XYC3]